MATQEPEVKAVPGSFNERWWLNRRRHRQRPDGVVGGDEPRARAEWFLSSRSGIEGHTCRVHIIRRHGADINCKKNPAR